MHYQVFPASFALYDPVSVYWQFNDTIEGAKNLNMAQVTIIC